MQFRTRPETAAFEPSRTIPNGWSAGCRRFRFRYAFAAFLLEFQALFAIQQLFLDGLDRLRTRLAFFALWAFFARRALGTLAADLRSLLGLRLARFACLTFLARLPFFTTRHFDGHPSVLLRASRVGEIDRDELVEIVQEAWLSQASARRGREWLRERGLAD